MTHVRTCLGLVVVDGKRVGSPSVSHSRRCGQSPAAAAVAQSTAVGMIGNVTKGAYPLLLLLRRLFKGSGGGGRK